MKIRLRPVFVPLVLAICCAFMAILVGKAPSETEMRLMDYAAQKKIPYASYPKSLIELMERNPETEEFVMNFPFHDSGRVDMSAYSANRGVPLFLKWDEQWGYMEYGGSYVAVTGSAPMCLAMAGYYASGGEEKFEPHRVVAFAKENGYDIPNGGRNLVVKGGTALGLSVKELSLVEQKIADYLRNGDPIIVSMGAGEFDDFVVFTGYKDGIVSLNDPDSYLNSEKQWVLDEIAGQIKSLWVVQRDN